jgi:ABC-type dipeptide/oligopeptide/nickel transport system ATPase component
MSEAVRRLIDQMKEYMIRNDHYSAPIAASLHLIMKTLADEATERAYAEIEKREDKYQMSAFEDDLRHIIGQLDSIYSQRTTMTMNETMMVGSQIGNAIVSLTSALDHISGIQRGVK